jgi:hypothetical protein
VTRRKVRGEHAGWTQSGTTGFTEVDRSAASSGNYGAWLGPVGSVDGQCRMRPPQPKRVIRLFPHWRRQPRQPSFPIAL